MMAKLYIIGYFKAFALTGRRGCIYLIAQGVALGYEFLPFQGVLAIIKTKYIKYTNS